jgi:lysine 2,3-aminomutase
VVDAPGGGGKIPVMPQYLISQSPGKVVLRNYEGYITTYDEPLDYDPHAIDELDHQATPRHEEGQSGVAALLEGRATSIIPEGFDDIHRRNGIQHRLNMNGQKWQRFHMGKALGVEPDGSSERNGNGHSGRDGNGHTGDGRNGSARNGKALGVRSRNGKSKPLGAE